MATCAKMLVLTPCRSDHLDRIAHESDVDPSTNNLDIRDRQLPSGSTTTPHPCRQHVPLAILVEPVDAWCRCCPSQYLEVHQWSLGRHHGCSLDSPGIGREAESRTAIFAEFEVSIRPVHARGRILTRVTFLQRRNSFPIRLLPCKPWSQNTTAASTQARSQRPRNRHFAVSRRPNNQSFLPGA